MCIFRGFQKSLRRLRCSELGGAAADDGGHAAADGSSNGGGTGLDALGEVVDDGTQLVTELTELVGHVRAEGVEVVDEARLDEFVRQLVERLLGGLDGVLDVVDVASDVLLGGVAEGDDVQSGLLDGQLAVSHGGFRELDDSGPLGGVHRLETVEHLDDALLTGQGDHTPMIGSGNFIPDGTTQLYNNLRKYSSSTVLLCIFSQVIDLYFHRTKQLNLPL